MSKFRTLKEAVNFITYQFRATDEDRKEQRFQSPHVYINRASYLYHLLGDPQKHYKIIHIAGTSGKGSTAHILGALLTAHKQTTGIYTSPHLLAYNERFIVNGKMITDANLLECLESVLEQAEKMAATSFGKPSFFEISNAVAYLYFAKQKVTYAITETHVGGLHDSTNTEQDADKLSLLTEISYDHQALLGNSLTAIAFQKAGIINYKSHVIALSGEKESNEVFENVAIAKQAHLTWIEPEQTYRNVKVASPTTVFDYVSPHLSLHNLIISLSGTHQVRNTSIALSALEHISKRDHWRLRASIVREVLEHIHVGLHGRIETIMVNGTPCILDVAHNQQKIQALINTLQAQFPNQKYNFLIAFKKDKDFETMLDLLLPLAQSIIITAFTPATFDSPFSSIDPKQIQLYLKNKDPHLDITTELNIAQALTKLYQYNNPIVVTGSFYLVAQALQEINLSQSPKIV